MIFYGTRASNIKNGQIINVECPNCQTNSSMNYSVFGKYAHIYWIPLFPFSKITIAECNSCKKTFEYKELPEPIKSKFAREKEKGGAKFPVWMFSGVFLIGSLVGYGFYKSNETDKNEADYIKNPKDGDVYYIKNAEGHYSTAKVDKATRTELYITYNDYEIDLESDIDRIDTEKNYTTSKDTVGVLQMQDFYKIKKIISIKRN